MKENLKILFVLSILSNFAFNLFSISETELKEDAEIIVERKCYRTSLNNEEFREKIKEILKIIKTKYIEFEKIRPQNYNKSEVLDPYLCKHDIVLNIKKSKTYAREVWGFDIYVNALNSYHIIFDPEELKILSPISYTTHKILFEHQEQTLEVKNNMSGWCHVS